jgi:alpha-glucosidase (family GH31 glycosyl hydrolase)
VTRERVIGRSQGPAGRRRPPGTATMVAALVGVVAIVAAAVPAAAGTLNTPGGKQVIPGRPGATHFADRGSSLVLTRPASDGAPGYSVVIGKNPFEVTTVRNGQTVLATTGSSASAAAARFVAGGTSYLATEVTSEQWQGGVLTLQLATTDPGVDVTYTVTPAADRYRVHWQVNGESRVVSSVGGDYALASAGDWYGEGIVENDQGAPYNAQPWPLSSGQVNDDEVGPFSYFVHNPFWFTKSSTGIWVDTDNVMNVQINNGNSGRASLLVTNSTRSNDGDVGAPAAVGDSRDYDATVFVESTPRAVYDDYIGIAGKPKRSDTLPRQYKTPLWDDWGDLHLGVTQSSFLAYAQSLADNHLPAHTVMLDDGWSAGYADHVFNQPGKFPDPKAMIKKIHKLGFDFGLWDTFYDNRDGDRASVLWPFLDQQGYLLKAVSNPIPFGTNSSCATTWFGGGTSDHPGLVDLANPAARAWLKEQIDALARRYGIDGWKFDTQIYDPKCQPYPGTTKADYLKAGLDFINKFNLAGQGMISTAWTGTQRYGFATDSIDKSANWAGLQAAAHQALAISVIGYPFTEMDMIGGSDGSHPPTSPTKPVLVRWAQAEALTPLMMGSVNPARYDQETINLYRDAIKLHERLHPYLMRQVARAVSSGEPIMKPIFFNYPDDQQSYTINDEWLFGDSLLAAPMLADATSRDIHVPAGRWYDVLRGCTVNGPANLQGYPVTLADVPMFVKRGTGETGMLLHALAHGRHAGASTRQCTA